MADLGIGDNMTGGGQEKRKRSRIRGPREKQVSGIPTKIMRYQRYGREDGEGYVESIPMTTHKYEKCIEPPVSVGEIMDVVIKSDRYQAKLIGAKIKISPVSVENER